MAKKDRNGTSEKDEGIKIDVQPDGETPPEPGRLRHRLPVMIHGQYIKDLSFENPNAPVSLQPAKDGKPVMDVSFSMDAQKIDTIPGRENAYEVTLGVRATAKKDGAVAFLLEVEYAASVSLDGVPEPQVHPMLLIEMPRYMFPYVRQIVSFATQQGGFPPLMLSPVDFRNFYLQRFGRDPEAEPAASADPV